MKRLVVLIMFCVRYGSSVWAYEMNTRDDQVLERADQYIQHLSITKGQAGLIPLFTDLSERVADFEKDEQGLFLLQEILEMMQDELHDLGIWLDRERIAYSGDGTEKDVSLQEKYEAFKKDQSGQEEAEELQEGEKEGDGGDEQVEEVHANEETKEKTSPVISQSMKSFYEAYGGKVTSTAPISDLCTTYYDEIDAIAKEHDFPAALIIATRYREHTCIFSNPSNGRGNFQITSHSYPPGDITRDQFKFQVINFIEFSRAKRDYYDAIQKFGPEPVTLSYNQIDLLSLRKHAILYNGVAAGTTPQNNIYANENFDRPATGRDGVVAMTLRAIGRGLEQQGVEVNVEENGGKEEIEEIEEEEEKEIIQLDKDTEEVTKNDCSDGEPFLVNLEKEKSGFEVVAMQKFLKEQGFFTADATGYYGEKTEQAVNAFQAYYKQDILDPGGYTSPTGQRYPATRRKANEVYCG